MLRVQIKFTNGNVLNHEKVLECWISEGKLHIRRYARDMSVSSVVSHPLETIEFQHVMSGN